MPSQRIGQIADLEATRVDLMDIYAMVLRKLGDAQSAQWVAATSGFGVESAVGIAGMAGRETAASPAQLATAIRQYEAELSHVRKVIASVESRLAQAPR
jgi:hypothetical protein